MIRNLRRVVFAVLTAVLVSVVMVEPTAEAAGGLTSWNRTTVYVVNELGSGWPVGAAAEAWSSPSRLDLIVQSRCWCGTSSGTRSGSTTP